MYFILVLNYEDQYKYLGVIFEEHLDFNTSAETLGAEEAEFWALLCIMQGLYQ